TTTVDSIDMTLVTMSTSVLSNLLDIGTDVDPVNGSPLITRLISENVIEVFDDLPEDAYDGQYDIKRSELYHIVTVLDILGIGDVDGDIDVENLDADT